MSTPGEQPDCAPTPSASSTAAAILAGRRAAPARVAWVVGPPSPHEGAGELGEGLGVGSRRVSCDRPLGNAPLERLGQGPDGRERLGRRRVVAVIDLFEEPERRLDPGAELAIIDRADELPAGPAGDEADQPEPVERQKLMGEQADDRGGEVAPPRCRSASDQGSDVSGRSPSGSASIRAALPVRPPQPASRPTSGVRWRLQSSTRTTSRIASASNATPITNRSPNEPIPGTRQRSSLLSQRSSQSKFHLRGGRTGRAESVFASYQG